VKKYFYVFRGLLAGIYVLQTHRIEPNIKILSKYFKLLEVNELIKLKESGIDTIVPENEVKYDKLIVKLFQDIDEAYIKSSLPEEPNPEIYKELNKYIVNLRKRFLFSYSK